MTEMYPSEVGEQILHDNSPKTGPKLDNDKPRQQMFILHKHYALIA